MIVRENYLGKILITDEYIKELVSKTVSECFGVSGMCCTSLKELVMSKIHGNNYPVGVNVRINDNSVKVTLHISAAYGTNISAVVSSVKHKVKFVLTENAGVEVDSVCVFVDEIKV